MSPGGAPVSDEEDEYDYEYSSWEERQFIPDVKKTGVQFRWMWAILGSDLPQTVKLTAVVTAFHGDEDGTNIRPSVETVAAKVGKSPRRVTTDRTMLRKTGWLKLADGAHSRTDGVSDRYELAIPDAYVNYKKPIKRAAQNGGFTSYEGYASPLLRDLEAKAEERRHVKGWLHSWFKAVVWEPAFTPAERLLATALGLASSTIGTNIHLGVPNMAAVTRMSPATVKRALAGLRQSDAALRAMVSRTNGHGLRDAYVLGMPDQRWVRARRAEREVTKARQSANGTAAVTARWPGGFTDDADPGLNRVQTWAQMRTDPGLTGVALPTTALPTSEDHADTLVSAALTRGARQNGHGEGVNNDVGSPAVGAHNNLTDDTGQRSTSVVVDLATYRAVRGGRRRPSA
jgi:hypothetical protein